MNDHLVALRVVVPQVDAGAKYILVKWIKHYGIGCSVQVLIKQIAIDLGASDRLVTEAIRTLIAAKVMKKERPVKPGRGSPRWSYRCTVTLTANAELVSLRADVGACHEPLIEGLLASKPGKFGREAKARLDKPDRLLLAILLLYADICGAVRGVSRSRLAALAGMDRGTLARRLRALRAAGYIRSYVPGVRGLHLFGAAPGMYFLNLNHPAYGQTTRSGVITVCESLLTGVGVAFVEGLSAFHLADGIQRDQLRGRASLARKRITGAQGVLVCDESFFDLLPLFDAGRAGPLGGGSGHQGHLAWYLQGKFEEYASVMLSEHWEALTEQGVPEVPDLLVRIESDIFPAGVLDGLVHERTKLESIRTGALLFVYLTSLLLARRVQRVMSVIPKHTFPEMVHCIIPCSRSWRQPVVRAVISSPRERCSVGALSTVFRVRRPGNDASQPISGGDTELDMDACEQSRSIDTNLGVLIVECLEQEEAVPRSRLELSGLLYGGGGRDEGRELGEAD